MQYNNLFAEPESALGSGHDYIRGGFLREKVGCVTFKDFWSLCLLPCIEIIKEEAQADNRIRGICGLNRNSP